jgi:hypothetical protein
MGMNIQNQPGWSPANPPPGQSKSSNKKIIAIVAIIGCCLVPVLIMFIGILSAIAIPAFVKYTRHSKTIEAKENLSILKMKVIDYCTDKGHLPSPAGPVPLSPRGEPQTPLFDKDEGGFAEVGFSITTPCYYSYQIESFGDGIRLVALGDLDGDGVHSEYAYVCNPDCSCTDSVEIKDELE